MPKSKEAAVKSFRRLVDDLLMHAQDEWPVVRELKNPASDEEGVETYHDFRKRLRTVLKIANYFPEVLPKLKGSKKEFLTTIVSKYGEVSDLLVSLEKADSKGKKEQAKKIRKEIKTIWQDIQAWEDEVDVPSQLEAMSN